MLNKMLLCFLCDRLSLEAWPPLPGSSPLPATAPAIFGHEGTSAGRWGTFCSAAVYVPPTPHMRAATSHLLVLVTGLLALPMPGADCRTPCLQLAGEKTNTVLHLAQPWSFGLSAVTTHLKQRKGKRPQKELVPAQRWG